MGDDVLSVRHWLYELTGIQTESLRVPKGFTRPMWFVEEPLRIPELRRADIYREKGTMSLTLLAENAEQLKQMVSLVRQDLADKRWTLPLYNTDRLQIGYMRECRLSFNKPDGFDLSIELKYFVDLPYTPVVYDPLEVIHTRFDPTLKKGGMTGGS